MLLIDLNHIILYIVKLFSLIMFQYQIFKFMQRKHDWWLQQIWTLF